MIETIPRTRVIRGDSREVLWQVPSASVDCCVTSPPYWMQRDYGDPRQIGLEADLGLYIEQLLVVMDGVRRALKTSGTLFLNLGDSYNAYNGNRGTSESNWKAAELQMPRLPGGYGLTTDRLPAKCLIGVPWRVALALADDGWVLRSEIIWRKLGSKPERSRDRPHREHEHVFLFSLGPDYYWSGPRAGTVWDVPGATIPGDHTAKMPLALAARCLEHGCPPGGMVLDPFSGAGTTLVAARESGRPSLGIDLAGVSP